MPLFPHLPHQRYSARAIARWLWHALRGNRRQASLNAVLGLASVALSLSTVWAMQWAIDVASGAAEGSLYLAVGAMAALTACDFGVSAGRIWIRNILGIKAQNQMQREMLDRLLRAEWQGRERHHSGDVVNRLEQDVATVVTFVTETLPGALSIVAMFVGAFAYLLTMDALLAIVTVAILPVFLLTSRFYVNRMRKFTRRVRHGDSRVQSMLQETVQHRMLIKTLQCDGLLVGRLDHTQSSLRRHVRRRTRFSVTANVLLNAGFAVGYLVAFLWSAVRLSLGSITFGAMTAFLQLVYRIQNPARELTRLAPAFVAVFTAAERLMELEELPAETFDNSEPMAGPVGVRLSGVSYAYEGGDRNVVDRLTCDFRPGTCTAVLGETGAGKTTLIRLMLALVRPTEGKIELYNAQSTTDATPSTRSNFVYVPQGNTLLSGTLRANLLLAKPDATDTELRSALLTACAGFVFDLPDGLDTKTTEGGAGLSEGQAQRIAIARALLRGRSIMLFDEATSALDPETERQLLQNVLSDNKRTVIFVTHRPAVIDYCDQVVRLGEG